MGKLNGLLVFLYLELRPSRHSSSPLNFIGEDIFFLSPSLLLHLVKNSSVAAYIGQEVCWLSYFLDWYRPLLVSCFTQWVNLLVCSSFSTYSHILLATPPLLRTLLVDIYSSFHDLWLWNYLVETLPDRKFTSQETYRSRNLPVKNSTSREIYRSRNLPAETLNGQETYWLSYFLAW